MTYEEMQTVLLDIRKEIINIRMNWSAPPSAAGGLLGVTTSTSDIRDAVHSSVAEDSTANKNLVVTLTLGAASVNLTVTVNTVHLELLKG